MSHENNDVLLAGGYSIASFRDLPLTHQLAIARYLAVDGEAWEWPDAMNIEYWTWVEKNPEAAHVEKGTAMSRTLVNHMEHFAATYGDMQIGVALVDMEIVKQHVLSVDPDIGDHGSWDTYHAWYKAGGGVPSHSDNDRWPCILSGSDDEAFEDGWHRLHSYAAAGHVDLPVVFFPAERHMDHESRMASESRGTSSMGMGAWLS